MAKGKLNPLESFLKTIIVVIGSFASSIIIATLNNCLIQKQESREQANTLSCNIGLYRGLGTALLSFPAVIGFYLILSNVIPMVSLVPVVYVIATVAAAEYTDWHIEVSKHIAKSENKREILKLEYTARINLVQVLALLAAAGFLSPALTVGRIDSVTIKSITLGNITYAAIIYVAFLLRIIYERIVEIRSKISDLDKE
ncbi:MAG: hypothetical protein V5A57_03080 [Candidatus Paceibacterota bacterium]